MNPREFQRLAQRLVASATPGAADCRGAIGRAYYAAFNVGAELLRGMSIAIGKGGRAHGEVRLCLANSGDPDVTAAASLIADLHTDRIRADYHLDRTDVEDLVNAKAIIKRASEAIQTLDTAFAGPKRPQIQAAIRSWRRANGYP